MKEKVIERRSLLKYCGLLGATAAGREFLAKWLPRRSPLLAATGPMTLQPPPQTSQAPDSSATSVPYAPQFFKPEEFQMVELLTEIIIPTDDKPGAKEAQVAQFIDFVVASAGECAPALQAQWTKGMALLDGLSRKQYGKSFRGLSATQREHLLTEMSLPERDSHARHPGFEFFQLVKGMTVEGFYTSRVGLMDVLDYKGLSVQSEFLGCTHPEHG